MLAVVSVSVLSFALYPLVCIDKTISFYTRIALLYLSFSAYIRAPRPGGARLHEKALTEYMLERLLLRDRVGSSGGRGSPTTTTPAAAAAEVVGAKSAEGDDPDDRAETLTNPEHKGSNSLSNALSMSPSGTTPSTLAALTRVAPVATGVPRGESLARRYRIPKTVKKVDEINMRRANSRFRSTSLPG